MTSPVLRDAVLSGRFSRPEVASGLAAFLGGGPGALTRWLGPDWAAGCSREQLRGLIDRDVAAIDALLSAQLDAILHHPRFQRLEGSWRGLAWLVQGVEPGQALKFVVLPATWPELGRDLVRTIEFDQSNVFRMIYENEFGRAGGEPLGLIVVDHEVMHRPRPRAAGDVAPVDDVSVLSLLASVAAAAFVPVVVAASPGLLGVDRFEELALSNDVAALMDGADYARWRTLAEREEARFLCVTMPRVLARPRWAAQPDCLWYEEHAPSTLQRTWFVAGYAFAAAVARSYLAHSWPADIRGVGADRIGGGLMLGLPTEDFVFGDATAWPRASLDLALTDRQERDLVLAGLMPLNSLPFGDAAFAAVHSLQTQRPNTPGLEPTPYQVNRRVSAQISAMLCVSRFAHYIKVMGRELTGSHHDADAIERRLQKWLLAYTNTSQSPTADSRARHPLASCAVQVHDAADRPGSFGCVVHLQPHYQLDDVSTTFRLVTGFGSPAPVG